MFGGRPTEQIIMGTAFTGMGLATMLFPNTVARLSLDPSFLEKQNNPALTTTIAKKTGSNPSWISSPFRIIFQCFGAQATLCGVLILSAKFTKATYATFGFAMVPFFVFDYIAWKYKLCTNFGAVGDLFGNIVFSVCCYIGYKRLSK